MVAPDGKDSSGDMGGAVRFQGDAVLLGPGWGKTPDRSPVLQKALAREAEGVPLILDADAIALTRDRTFHGNCILTPHPGEFAAWSGLPKEAVLANPGPVLTGYARQRRLTILFKSHVLYIAAEDGRVGILDGMAPVLAAGGSGDLLAGLCVAIAARMRHGGRFDGYTAAALAASLLLAAGAQARHRFTDPLELADIAADIAGAAWL
jgi:NAD(P)H-hydrate epimerase